MGAEFIEIDHIALRQILQTNGITRSHLATELNVATKTIQRWLNGTIKRIKVDTFQDLERCLGTSGQQIRKHDQEIFDGPADPSLQILCDQYFYQRVRCNYDWHGYRLILKSYIKRDLPSNQRIEAFKQIGAASMHMGEVESARYHLEKALKLAEITENYEEQIYILSWIGTRYELIGNLSQAISTFQKAEALLNRVQNPMCRANYHFLYGRLLGYMERYEDSAYHLRKSIRIDLANRKPAEFITSVKYFHLIGTYLKSKELNLAASAIHRNAKNTQRNAWIYGQAYNYFAELVLQVLTGKAPTDMPAKIQKGRRLRGLNQYHHIDCRADQLEYFLYLYSGMLIEAKDLLKKRFFKNRRSPLHFSRTVLDALFLQKLFPDQYSVRPSFIEKAELQFARNNLRNSLRLLEYLQTPGQIPKQKLLEMFPF